MAAAVGNTSNKFCALEPHARLPGVMHANAQAHVHRGHTCYQQKSDGGLHLSEQEFSRAYIYIGSVRLFPKGVYIGNIDSMLHRIVCTGNEYVLFYFYFKNHYFYGTFPPPKTGNLISSTKQIRFQI